MDCCERFYMIVLTELCEQISKHSTRETAGQVDYDTIATPDAYGYQELEMSRR